MLICKTKSCVLRVLVVVAVVLMYGALSAQQNDAPKFKAIVVKGTGNVTIAQTGKESIAQDDPNTGKTEIKDGVLYLEGAANFRIGVKELTRLELPAAGKHNAL